MLKRMMTFNYKEETYIADHLNEFHGLLTQLLGMGIKFDDQITGLWLLATLLDSWETF